MVHLQSGGGGVDPVGTIGVHQIQMNSNEMHWIALDEDWIGFILSFPNPGLGEDGIGLDGIGLDWIGLDVS